MNTTQIDNVLPKHVKYFQDVYPIVHLPSTLIQPSIIVLNLNKHYMPSSHWVAACSSDSGYAEYLDLHGLPPYKLEIIALLQRQSISWTFNHHRQQGLTSKVCAHYCLIYALNRGVGHTLKSFVDIFVPARYTCNDKKAVRLFRA